MQYPGIADMVRKGKGVMKKAVIVGGGIAGMTAGIYLQKAGIQTEIFEKNPVLG